MDFLQSMIWALVIASAAAKQKDWTDTFRIYPSFENDIRLPVEHPINPYYYREPVQHTNNLLKRQDSNSFQRALALKACTSCCCAALYKPRNIVLAPDIYVTVMEVSGCNNICPGINTCTRVASSIEWSKMGFPVNNTAVFTACSCVP